MSASLIGWVATAAFGVSYLPRRQAVLRTIQAGAACLWITYGLAINAVPVVVANLIGAGAAVYSLLRREPTEKGQGTIRRQRHAADNLERGESRGVRKKGRPPRVRRASH